MARPYYVISPIHEFADLVKAMLDTKSEAERWQYEKLIRAKIKEIESR